MHTAMNRLDLQRVESEALWLCSERKTEQLGEVDYWQWL
jgi:hypothetical protein